MTSSPTFFTVEADFRAVLEDISSDSDYDPQIAPISGTVTFTPILNSGDVILATDADPRPIGFLPTPVVGKIDPADGRLKLRTETDLGGEGEFAPVRLLADTDLLELSTPLYYRVEFSSIRLGSRVGKITGFSFRAPTSDTTVNLIEVGRAPGLAASGTYHIAPAAVRVVDDEMVFSFGGVDIPDPVPLVDLTGPAVAAQAASEIHAAAEKASPVDADEVPLLDSAASFGWKRWSWVNIKAALGAWYDTATRTLTNKTLSSPTILEPRVDTLRDSSGNASISNAYERVYLSPKGRPSFQAFAWPSSATFVQVVGNADPGGGGTGSAEVNAGGTPSNVNLDLRSQGSGVVRANYVPVVTTSGTATLTNKTIDGASNTITNLPASATPDVARFVATTTYTGAANNQWTKILSWTSSTAYYSQSLVLDFIGHSGSPCSATVLVRYGNTSAGVAPTGRVYMMSRAGLVSDKIYDDSFKLIGGAFGEPVELWMKCGVYVGFRVYETSFYNNGGTLQYYSSGALQGTEPVGTGINVSTSGVVIDNGAPIATTNGTQTLSGKTLSSPTVDGIKDSNGKLSLGFYANPGANGYFQLTNGTTAVNFSAQGSESNIAAQIISKGTGTITLSSSTNAGWAVWPQGTEYLGTYSAAAGTDPKITAQGTGANVGINLVPKGSGAVQANGVPIVTTSGTATLTNKTISGANNTFSAIPQSAVTGLDAHVNAAIRQGYNLAYNADFEYDNLTLLAGSSYDTTIKRYGTRSVKVQNLGGNYVNFVPATTMRPTDIFYVELYVYGAETNTLSTGTLEIDVLTYDGSGGIRHHLLQLNASPSLNGVWTKMSGFIPVTLAATKGGSIFFRTASVPSSEIYYIDSPLITNASQIISQLQDVNGNAALQITGASGAVNYLAVTANVTGSAPRLTAVGSDTNISLDLLSKGSGTVKANGVDVVTTTGTQALTNKTLTSPTISGTVQVNGDPVGVKVAVPASNSATGTPGQWAADTDYIYVCTATDTWRRAALSTW